MEQYRGQLDELENWLRGMDDCPGFDRMLLADAEAIRSYPGDVPRSELRTVEEFAGRYGELKTRNLPWINLQGAGILDGALVVLVDTPPDSTANREGETKVNISGPSQRVRDDADWDVRRVIPFAD